MTSVSPVLPCLLNDFLQRLLQVRPVLPKQPVQPFEIFSLDKKKLPEGENHLATMWVFSVRPPKTNMTMEKQP